MIDLHVHTNKSDGLFSPREIVEKAKDSGISVVAITDHDTCDGIEEAIKRAEELNIKVIPGIEITAFDKEEIHVLGYNVNHKSWLLFVYKWYLKKQLKKEEKNIIRSFKNAGINIDEKVLRKKASKKILEPADFDYWLVENGYEKSTKQAYKKYFKDGELRYRKKGRISIEKAILFVTLLGGIAVLAHPCRIVENVDLDKMISKLNKKGLKGIEVYYSTATSKQINRYEELAQRYCLHKTLGSDYHGYKFSDIQMGHGLDNNLDKYKLSVDDLAAIGINSEV